MTPLLVVIPLSAPDLPLVSSLLATIQHHTPPPNHAVLFVADHSLPLDSINPILAQAKPIFPSGGSLVRVPIDLPTPDYPFGHNIRFETAARHIAANIKVPWLFLTPQCVPLRRGWLMDIEREYFTARKEILGQHLASPPAPLPLVPCTAVYPPTLPKRAFQRLVSRRSEDFERTCADLFLPITAPTNLIWTHINDGTTTLPQPPASAALIHTVHALSYAAKLRGDATQPAPVAVKDNAVAAPAPTPLPTLTPAARTYYHSGNLGDIIYALSAIKLAGGGSLLLGPKQRRTPPCSSPIKPETFSLLEPLLAHQPYLTSTTYAPRHPGTDTALDLNQYRSLWTDAATRSSLGIHNLARIHCHLLHVNEKFHPSQTWLEAPSQPPHGYYILHRSPRYQNPAFDWAFILNTLRPRPIFIGHASEHREFCSQYSISLPHYRCANFLDLATLLASSRGFLGNQSFPCALAIALGIPVCQETNKDAPDCLFPRPNFISNPTPASFKAWLEPAQ